MGVTAGGARGGFGACAGALGALAGAEAGPAAAAACGAGFGTGRGGGAGGTVEVAAAADALEALVRLKPPKEAQPAFEALERSAAAAAGRGLGGAGDGQRAEMELARAEGLMKAGRFAESEPLLELLGRRLPHHPLPHFFRGCIAQSRGDFAAACALYNAALELRPELLSARGNLVACLMDRGEFGAATEHAELLTRLDGANPGRWFLLGVVHMRAGDLVAAARSYKQALSRNPAYMEAYVNLDSVLLKLGGRLEECREWAQRAVDADFGFWEHALQRPPHFIPRIRSRPWWDPQQFGWARELEANFPLIKAELLAILTGPKGMPWGSVGGRSKHDRSLVRSGDWKEFVLLGNSDKVGQNLSMVPVTASILTRAPDVLQMATHGVGESLFSVISPGTHLRPHCGSTNGRLTAHFGLVVPEGCSIRCGDEIRTWEEGKVIVFDDSYEHEVWHRGEGARIVLLINFWHPDVPPHARRPIELSPNHTPG